MTNSENNIETQQHDVEKSASLPIQDIEMNETTTTTTITMVDGQQHQQQASNNNNNNNTRKSYKFAMNPLDGSQAMEENELDEQLANTFSTSKDEETSIMDASSDSLLSIASTGFCGVLERIPLAIKLIFMCVVSVAGMLIVGVFLIAVQAKDIQKVRLTHTFQTLSSDLGQLVGAMQAEREYSSAFFIANASDPVDYDTAYLNLKNTIERADRLLHRVRYDIRTYKLRGYSAMGVEVDKMEFYLFNETQLSKFRNDTLNGKTSTYNIFRDYNNVVNACLNVLQKFAFVGGSTQSATSYVLLLRILEMEEQIRAAGNNAYTQQLLTPLRFRTFAQFRANRDYLLGIWKSSNSLDMVAYYDTLVSGSVASSMTNMELYIVPSNDRNCLNNVPVTAYTIQDWRNNSTAKIVLIRQVGDRLEKDMLKDAKDSLSRSVTIIVVMIVLIVFFFFLATISSTIVSFTIVGPWRRLNKIQEEAISKFVPRPFLKLLGCDRITDISLGQWVKKDLTMMVVEIKDFQNKLAKQMKSDRVFEFLNTYLNHVGPLIRRNGGFIHSHKGESFQALFKDSKSGIKAGIEVQAAIESFNINNAEHYPPVTLGCSVHTAPVLVGTVGENERMEGTLISAESYVAGQLEKLCIKFSTGTLTTRSALQNCGKSIYRHIDYRMLGTIMLETDDNRSEAVEVFEILKQTDSAKAKTKAQFQNAVILFQQGLYSQAIPEFEKVLEETPNDIAAIHYQNKAQQLLNETRYITSTLSLRDALREPCFLQALEEFSKSEFSTENVLLWKEVDAYKRITDATQRRAVAQSLYDTFLSMDGEYTINVNEKSKIVVATKLQQNLIDAALFAGIEFELEGVMADTFKRFKESPLYAQAFQRSKYCPTKPTLDQL